MPRLRPRMPSPTRQRTRPAGKAIMWITKTSINQPVFATMVMVALLVLGVFAYLRLPVEQMPDVSDPTVSLQVDYPGASPEALENDVIKPIENQVNSVNGVKRIFATMREG